MSRPTTRWRPVGRPAIRWRRRVLRVAELIPARAEAVSAETTKLPRRITAAIAELPVGTLLTLEQHRSVLDVAPRWLALARLAGIERRSARLTIVAAALIRDGRVLIGCRNHPEELAGRWEFPGGKAERGETPQAALVREVAEELGARIEVGAELARHELPDGAYLVLLAARLAPGSPEPRPLEHRQLCWADAAALADRNWAGTNGQFVADVTGRL